MKVLKQIASVAVLAIGVYMLATNWGPVSAPMLSGAGFTLLGLLHCHKAFFCCHSGMKK